MHSHSVMSDSYATPWSVLFQASLSMGFPRQGPMDRGAWQTTVHGVAKELDVTCD